MPETDPPGPDLILRRRLAQNPHDLDALLALAGQLADRGEDKEAEALARRAHDLDPAAPQPLRILGRLLQLQGRYDDALALSDAALATDPSFAAAWQMRGDSLANAGRRRDAIAAYLRALEHDDAGAFDTLVRLGKMHRVLGEADAAVGFFDRAAQLRPASAIPTYERGLLRLENGDFARGWPDYDTRWSTEELLHTRGFVPKQIAPLLTRAPSAADLVGKRVLLIGDQGIGDQVMFASLIGDLARTASSVLCLCEPRLLRLLRNAFPAITFMNPVGAQVDGDTVDVLLAMSSLGSAFRQTAADFPDRPYLQAQAEGVARWTSRLGPPPAGLRIGVSWRGGVPQTNRTARSIPLQAWRPLLELADCQVVSLQYGDVREEIAEMNATLSSPLLEVPPQDISDFQDFADLIQTLDVVVSVQNATVHLTGGLGKPCLALLPENPEWRYMRRGTRMPWYGSVHLLRQTEPGDWRPVISQAVALVQARLDEAGRPDS